MTGVVLNDDGNWEWFDHFGRIEIDRKLPLQDVEGKVLLDNQAAARQQLEVLNGGLPRIRISTLAVPPQTEA